MLNNKNINWSFVPDAYPVSEIKQLHSEVDVVCHYDGDGKYCHVTIKIYEYILSDSPKYFAKPSMTFQSLEQGSPYIDTHSYDSPEEAFERCLRAIVGFGHVPRNPILIDDTPYSGGMKRWDETKKRVERKDVGSTFTRSTGFLVQPTLLAVIV